MRHKRAAVLALVLIAELALCACTNEQEVEVPLSVAFALEEDKIVSLHVQSAPTVEPLQPTPGTTQPPSPTVTLTEAPSLESTEEQMESPEPTVKPMGTPKPIATPKQTPKPTPKAGRTASSVPAASTEAPKPTQVPLIVPPAEQPTPVLKPTDIPPPAPTPAPVPIIPGEHTPLSSTPQPTATPVGPTSEPGEQDELVLAAKVAYLEAKGNGEEAYRAVLSVIYNRCKSSRFGGGETSITTEVFRKSQFSVVNNSKFDTLVPPSEILEYARDIFENDNPDLPSDVVFFRAARLGEEWGSRTYYKTIGGNAFFK